MTWIAFLLSLLAGLSQSGPFAPDETIAGYADPAAIYRLAEMNGKTDLPHATIAFPGRDRVTGTGPCNHFQAEQRAPYPWIEIGPLRATRRACPDLAFEHGYFGALSKVSLAEIQGPTLVLTDETRALVLVFRALK